MAVVPGTEKGLSMPEIIVVGSIAQDDVVHLVEPLRIGAHVEGRGRGARLGGGGVNTSVPLAYAGHHVALVSAVGQDAEGISLLGELRATGVDIGPVHAVTSSATTRSIVMLDAAGERTIVNLQRCAEPEPPHRLLDLPADILYVRSRADDLAPLMAEKAKTCFVVAHVPPCIDGARPAQVLVCSESDVGPDFLADPFAAGRRIAGDLLRWVVVTHGAKGASAHSKKAVFNAKSKAVTPVDSTGAGDAFAAGMIHGLAGGKTVRQAVKVGILWGAEAVRTPTSMLTRDAVARLVAK